VITTSKPIGSGAFSAARVGTREVGIWSISIVAFAYWTNVLRGGDSGIRPDLDSMITHVLDNGAFDVFAWTLIMARLTRMSVARPATWPQILTVFALGIIVLPPVRLATGLALVILGGLLLKDRNTLPAGRHVGLVLLALALETVWISPPMAPLHVLVGRADASICVTLFGLFGINAVAHANMVENLTTNFAISIWPYCTSTLPLAGVSLAFLVMCLYLDHAPRWRDLPWLGLSFLASILLTEVRLVLLAMNESSYHWWHDGTGVTIYTIAALGLAVVFPILATREAPTAETTPGARPTA
jgi:exosortase/archaeosortase family protein